MIAIFFMYCVDTCVVITCDGSLFVVYKTFGHDMMMMCGYLHNYENYMRICMTWYDVA